VFCFKVNKVKTLLNESKVAYLLGSGISIPFCLPGVNRLTELILKSEQFASLHTDQCYHVGVPAGVPLQGEVTTHIAVDFIRFVKSVLSRKDTLNMIQTPNYEDIADFIKQYHLSLINEYENPALSQLCMKEIKDFASQRKVEVPRLLNYSIILIDCMLQYFLNHNHAAVLSKIELIQNMVPDFLIGNKLDLFTLNHDLIMEDYLATRGISYTDGFYPNQDKLNYFDFNKFWQSSDQVRLVKLHGSIDRYYHNQSMIKVSDPRYINDPGSNGFSDNFVPSVLSGKIVKMLDYSKPIHADLYGYFRVKLATEISKLIVVGYGFGDKGINNAISSWFKQNNHNCLIVITLKEDTLIANSRFAMASILQDRSYRNNRRIVILDGGIENCTSNSIRDALS